MHKAKKALHLFGTLTLLAILAFAMASVDVIVTGEQHWLFEPDTTQIESDDDLAKKSRDRGFDPMTNPGVFPESYQCVDELNRQIGNWKIHIDAQKLRMELTWPSLSNFNQPTLEFWQTAYGIQGSAVTRSS